MQRLEIDGLIVRRVLVPAPIQDADPFERQRSYGSLMGLALVALLLVVDLRPEGMPDRLRRPLDERLPEEFGTLETPVHPGLLAAAFGHRRDPSIFLEFGGRGIALPVFAKGDQEAGSEDGTCPRERLEEREVGMALCILRDGSVEVGNRLQGDAELGDEGLHQERMGRDNPVISGEGCRRLDGLDTLGNDIGIAHVMRTEEGFKSGTARELHGLEGRPAMQEVAEERGVFVLKPLQHLREIVLERTGQAVGDPDFVTNHTAAVFDELGERPHRRALRLKRLQLVAVGQQQFELKGGIGGSSLARLGVKASRYRASVSGLMGKRTRKSYGHKAETRGPLLSSRQMAIGCPLNRVRNVRTHESIASGVCVRLKHSRCAEPAACRQTSCLRSAQSIPMKAANSSCAPCFM